MSHYEFTKQVSKETQLWGDFSLKIWRIGVLPFSPSSKQEAWCGEQEITTTGVPEGRVWMAAADCAVSFVSTLLFLSEAGTANEEDGCLGCQSLQ